MLLFLKVFERKYATGQIDRYTGRLVVSWLMDPASAFKAADFIRGTRVGQEEGKDYIITIEVDGGAPAIARAISRFLREKGFAISERKDRHRSTEGFDVHRVGCSHTVAVSWWLPGGARGDADRARRDKFEAEAHELLTRQGYPVTGRLNIECDRSG